MPSSTGWFISVSHNWQLFCIIFSSSHRTTTHSLCLCATYPYGLRNSGWLWMMATGKKSWEITAVSSQNTNNHNTISLHWQNVYCTIEVSSNETWWKPNPNLWSVPRKSHLFIHAYVLEMQRSPFLFCKKDILSGSSGNVNWFECCKKLTLTLNFQPSSLP